VTQLVEQFNVM